MKNLTPRARALIFAGLALVALIGLAATLNSLEFDPGSPMAFWELGPQVYDANLPEEWQRMALALLRVMMIVLWLLFPVFILLFIFSKRFRRQFLRDMMIILPMIIALYFYYRMRAGASGVAMEEMPAGNFDLGELTKGLGDNTVPPPVYTPPDAGVTNLITTLIALLIAAAVLGIGWYLYRRSRNRKLEPLRKIQEEAQSALDEIEAGADLRDVILRAYQQMTLALRQFRNIQRDQYMTPHEFESYLALRGLPRGPVHQLTELFERVRYGGAAPGRADERTAVASLSAIVAYCQREGSEKP